MRIDPVTEIRIDRVVEYLARLLREGCALIVRDPRVIRVAVWTDIAANDDDVVCPQEADSAMVLARTEACASVRLAQYFAAGCEGVNRIRKDPASFTTNRENAAVEHDD